MKTAKPEAKGLLRFTHTIRYSINGLKVAWKYEESFRQECIIFLIMTPVAFFLGTELWEVITLIATLWFLLIVELLNSAIEAVVDRIGLERHELSKHAKDLGSAAVMLTIFLTLVVWGTIAYIRLFS